MPPSRFRNFLGSALAGLAVLLASLASPATPQDATPTVTAALDAVRWIRSTVVQTDKGPTWPAVPGDPKSVDTALYHGAAGIVLFFLDAHRSTGDASLLTDARLGADFLLRSLDGEKRCGLYEGLAGVGFALQETFKATQDAKYRDGAKRCVQMLRDRAKTRGVGVEWDGSTDIISGSAGIGLFLLYAAREQQDFAARALAVSAGKRLVELSQPAAGGRKWAMNPTFNRTMPNFSHGTAGVAYFLATLAQETKDKTFLDAALAGAKYLQAVAKTDGDGCLIFHHEPGGEDLFYLGWCHGPPGTARLFYRLHQATGDRQWRTWFDRCARSVLKSGLPDKQLPGFWNNVSACCGSAGVGQFALDAYRVTGDKQYLSFARLVTDDLLRRATRDEHGTRWVQAEHRIKPDLLIAHTGYMQGAAGVGDWLLRVSDAENSRQSPIIWPDNPFPTSR